VTAAQIRTRLYAKANELDAQGAHARAHELRKMVLDVDRAEAEVRDYSPPRKRPK
jgi:hypothetical protein